MINGNLIEPALIVYEFGLMLPFAIKLEKEISNESWEWFLSTKSKTIYLYNKNDVVNDLLKRNLKLIEHESNKKSLKTVINVFVWSENYKLVSKTIIYFIENHQVPRKNVWYTNKNITLYRNISKSIIVIFTYVIV